MAFEGSFSWTEWDPLEGIRGLRLESRFDPNVVGSEEWRALVERARAGSSLQAADVLARLQELPAEVPQRRLFISHRRSDLGAALEVAAIATACGYQYWLDVEDPVLAGLNAAPDDKLRAILVAAVIEIALLNCTHVIAVLTSNTFGHVRGEPAQSGPSLWIPYEFARAKARTVVSNQAAAWVKRGTSPFPEYLFLGRILPDKPAIEKWLSSQNFSSLRR